MNMGKITGLKTWICTNPVKGNIADSTRLVADLGYVIVEIETDLGISGIGITYHEAGSEAIKMFIDKTIAPLIIGMNPLENEVVYDKVVQYFRAVGRKGLAFCALSAVDIALWDIKGKVTGLPVYRLLGGGNNRVPVYSSAGWTSYTTKELCREAESMVADGYSMIKIKVGVEGGNNFREDLRRVQAVRKTVGPDIKIALDANNIWTAGTAVQFASRAEEYDIEFFEEPVPADDIPGLVHCRRSMRIPLATGEHEYTRFGARDLLGAGAVDVLQVDACRSGGYTETMKVIALSQAYNVKFAPHCMELMHMHMVAAAGNGLTLESLTLFRELTGKVFIDPPVAKNGMLQIPETPGMGLELNREYVEHNCM